ncbi:unnamed protein product, partial [Rotaria magnacalcarata]
MVYIPRSGSTVSVEKTPIWSEPEIYDWSKHERFSLDDIINSKPERVRQLL